jgi:holo-[acyl-carrier protein] synthase
LEKIHHRHGEVFILRFCRPGEWQTRQGNALIEHLGGLFAAKEAVLKALGTGWAEGLAFRQVEVRRAASGAPSIQLHGRAKERSDNLGVSSIHLSITHERSYAAAMAILEGTPLEIPAGQAQESSDEH